MQEFVKTSTGLKPTDNKYIPIYDNKEDLDNDLDNLKEGQIVATKSSGDEDTLTKLQKQIADLTSQLNSYLHPTHQQMLVGSLEESTDRIVYSSVTAGQEFTIEHDGVLYIWCGNSTSYGQSYPLYLNGELLYWLAFPFVNVANVIIVNIPVKVGDVVKFKVANSYTAMVLYY